MALPITPQRKVILQKLRQCTGQNYMLCHQAGDEIVRLRKEIKRLDVENQILEMDLAAERKVGAE